MARVPSHRGNVKGGVVTETPPPKGRKEILPIHTKKIQAYIVTSDMHHLGGPGREETHVIKRNHAHE